MIEIWDTSALILAARQPGAARVFEAALAEDEVAVTEPIVLEYLNGTRNLAEYDRFREALGAAHLVETTPAAWQRGFEVHRELAATGAGHQRSVRLVDLLVAAVAELAGHVIVHVDEDYERIAGITGQPTRRLV